MTNNYIQQLYRMEDIQTIFSCGKGKAYEIIHTNGFPKIQIGRRYYVVPSEFDKWLKSNGNKKVC